MDAPTGQMLNLTELAPDADVAVNTAKNWLSILQASLQVFLLVQDQILYPLEIKKSASPRREWVEWVEHFSALSRLKQKVGGGGVLCLCKQLMPLTPTANAIPIGII